jgi:hypothetical protein
MKTDCYTFKIVNFDNSILDSFIDMTYVLVMENSKREKNMYKELNLFKPTKKVKIQYNKGFKNCKKKLYDYQTNWDLMDATYNIMLDAKKNDYKNILILEEDFIANNDEITNKNIKNIKNYITNEKIDVYLLGNFIPSINVKFNTHLKCSYYKLPCGGTHGYIITNTGIDTFIHLYKSGNYNLLKNISNNGHIDWLYNSTYFKTYYYYKPLIIQPLEETENLLLNNFSYKISNKLIYKLKLLYINLFGLNKKNKNKLINSYNNLYTYSKILIPVFFIIILFIIFIIINNAK